jgi:hypothetical protein
MASIFLPGPITQGEILSAKGPTVLSLNCLCGETTPAKLVLEDACDLDCVCGRRYLIVRRAPKNTKDR